MAAKDPQLRESNMISFSHRWTLYNFAHLYDADCQWKWGVQSDVFSVPGNENLKFTLTIWPKEKDEEGEEYLKVGLLTEAIPEMLQGKVTIREIRCIEDREGRKVFTKGYPEIEVYPNTLINEDEFVPVARLLDPSTGHLRRGTLTVLTQKCNAHTFSSTTIPSSVSRFSHRFTIAHFKWLTEESTGEMPLRVESQYFAPQREDIGQMQILFYPKGPKGSDKETVGIAIQNENASSLLVHWEWSLVNTINNSKGGKCYQNEYTNQIAPLSSRTYPLTRRNLLSLLSSLPKDELTIDWQLTVLAQENIENTPTPSCSFTDLALFTYHYVPFTWTIERYLKQVSTQECAISPLFSPPTDSRLAAFLRVYPKKDKENVKIELNFASNCSINECKVNWQYTVVNREGEEWNRCAGSFVLEKGKGIGPFDLISHQTLDNYRSILLPDDKLTIKSQLWIHEPRKNLPPELSNLPSKDPSASLARGVTNLIIGDNATFTNSILAAGTTLTAGNIAQSSVSKSAESEPKPK